MLTVVKVTGLKCIVCLEHMLYRVMDALGLGSAVSSNWDAAMLDLQSLLKTCQCLAVQLSHRRGRGRMQCRMPSSCMGKRRSA